MAELEQRALRAAREAARERRLAAAEERTRIARDLHDSGGHAINVILVHAGLGRLRANRDPGARETFETIEEVARQTVADIDQLVAACARTRPGAPSSRRPGWPRWTASRSSALEITVAHPVRADRTARASRAGHGMIGMRERAALLGGSLHTTVQNGRFRLHVRLLLTPGGP